MATPSETLRSYDEFDRQTALQRIKVGVVLTCIVLPLGSIVDAVMYDAGQWRRFLAVRFAFSGVMLLVGLLIYTPWGRRRHRALGVALAMVPAGCMAWIIHATLRSHSTYYAGLNLVLLAVGLLLRWNTLQSIVATVAVLLMYFAACLPIGSFDPIFVNNVFFISLTGLIVVLGNTMYTRLRKAEHAAMIAVDEKRRELETANGALAAKSAELELANSSLETSRAELQVSLKRLQELDELKRNFFANISHELRTPLTLILAPLDRLRSSDAIRGEPDLRVSVETMQAHGFRLLKLINDLLDLVRLEAGTLRLERRRFHLPTFIRGIQAAMQPAATEKNIRLLSSLSPDAPEIEGDTHQLERVLFNLVFNAIKFTPADGSVTLSTAREQDWIVIRVTDTGIGIDPSHLPRIFERFWQVDASAQRKYQGAGIGLSLVRDLTEAHGGGVSAESTPGKGTSIVVRLPAPAPGTGSAADSSPPENGDAAADSAPVATRAEEPAAADGEWLSTLYRRAELFPGIPNLRESSQTRRNVPRTDSRPAGPRILIADDEPDMLVFLRTHLEAEFEVLEAVDGNAAVTLASQYLPEVVICDMMMPEKNGIQVCRELQARPETRSIPFLMLTARADDETKLAALSAGAHDFLCKPYSSAELAARVRNLAQNHRLQRELGWQNRKLESTIEQLKETEMNLVQSEKLASLGRLSAGILHEINNPLNFAKTAVYTLKKQAAKLPPESRGPIEINLKDLSDGIDRVVKIVTDMRKFSHQGGAAGGLVRTEVRPVLDSALRFLSAELRDRVEVVIEVPDSLAVEAHPGKLLQVFTNLLQNALDALASRPGGTSGPPEIRIRAGVHDGMTVVRIHDNGTGIPADVLGKIFDPFFTTKEVGKGTGLGLSICFRIMNEFGGAIRVATEPGLYTEFALEFPPVFADNTSDKSYVRN
jgi:signal transduction histidine kinase